MVLTKNKVHVVAYYPCRTQPHQVLTRTLSYQHLCWTRPHPALKRTICYQRTEEVQLPLGLTPLGDPIQSIRQLWNQPSRVGTHHGFVFGKKKSRCPLLWLRSNRTRTNALGSNCYYGSNHLGFTITPTTAAVCFRWVLSCGCYATVLLIVPVTTSAVVPIFWLTPHHGY